MTGLHVAIAGLFKSVADTNVFRTYVASAAAWKDVTFVRVFRIINNQGAWHDVWVRNTVTPTPAPSPTPTPTPAPVVVLSVTPSPSSVSGTRVGTGIVYTNKVTVTASLGTPPYTYKFTRGAYSGSIVPQVYIGDVTKPNVAQFSRDMEGAVPETETATFKCRVTDSAGNSGTCTIGATFLTTAVSGTGGDGTVNNNPWDQTGGGPQGGQIP